MLTGRTVDARDVIHRAIRLLSIACCVLVATSFALFGHDQVAGATVKQTRALAARASVAPPVTGRVRTAGQPRRLIDEAAARLTSPFDEIVRSDNPWVRRGLSSAVALLVYGLGLGMLARYAEKL